ncbi:MAG: hypothetical protein AAGJ52_02935 [Pseudomonadota bacterium]
MEDFSLALALYDFVPVVLTGIGVFSLAALVRKHRVPWAFLATVGATLVFAAGMTKACWKLVVTLSAHDLTWLASLLFPLMAPGFALLAAGIWASRRQRQKKSINKDFWLMPLAIIGVAAALALFRVDAGIERGWFLPALSLASLSNIALTVMLFMTAWQNEQRLVAVLFTVNLAMVFALIPIAQFSHYSIAMHWFEQTLTTIGAAAFAYAAYRLGERLSVIDIPKPLEPHQ